MGHGFQNVFNISSVSFFARCEVATRMGQTALFKAVLFGHMNTTERLLEAGAQSQVGASKRVEEVGFRFVWWFSVVEWGGSFFCFVFCRLVAEKIRLAVGCW